MNRKDEARSVVTDFGAEGASALSLQAAAKQLVAEESWSARLALMTSDSRLVDASVARWCDGRGEGLLAMFIARAVEVGVPAAGAELPAATTLLSIARDDAVEWSETIQAVRDAADLVAGGASWLQPVILQVVGVLVARIRHRSDEAGAGEDALTQLAELRGEVERLVSAAGCDPNYVGRIVMLARAEWESVWDTLPMLINDHDVIRSCTVARGIAEWFEIDGRHVAQRIGDLWNLVEAAQQRGAAAAVEEHRLVLFARAAPVADCASEGERAQICAAAAEKCATYFQRTGAVWVLRAAVEPGRVSRRLTPQGQPDRATYASTLGSLLVEAVQAGVIERSALNEAVECQREAYALTSEGHPDRATYASALGTALAVGVRAGVVEPAKLPEAVDYTREAYRLTPEDHARRAAHASNLGNRLAAAVRAGRVKPNVLSEALNYHREAYRLTPEDHQDRAGCASNLAGAIATAVRAGLAEPRTLAEAVDYAQEAFRLTPEGHSDRASFASNVGSLLAEAVWAGVAEPRTLGEAVDYAREAYHLTPNSHPNRAACASNLSNRIGAAVQAGVVEAQALGEAVNCATEAYRLTPEDHVDRAMYASSLGNRVADAVQVGVFAPEELAEAVAYAREAYRLTPEGHPSRAMYASNLSSLLAAAVQAAGVDSDALADAVDYAREAYRLTPSDHPNRATYASNLGNHLGAAVHAGVIEPRFLPEALGYLREAYRVGPESDADRAKYASNLGSVLALTVRAGLVESSVLEEVMAYQREAYRLTPVGHPDRATYASNLGSRLADAVQAGVIGPEGLNEAVREALAMLDELWRLARTGVTATHRRRLLSTTRGVSGCLPLMLLRTAGPREAVRAVETLRGHVTGGMHAPPLPVGLVDAALDTAYRQAAMGYEAAQVRAREGMSSYADTVPAMARLAELVDQVRATAAGQEGFDGRPEFNELCAGLPPHAVGIYLLPAPGVVVPSQVGRWSGAAVVVRSDGRTMDVPLPDLTSSAVLDHVDALLTTSTSAQRVCAWLWQAVATPLLAHGGELLTEASDWFVVPTQSLGMLPIHAAGSAKTGWLDDHVTVRVTPSLLALAEPACAVPASGLPTVAISGANDLAFLTADRAAVLALIPHAAPVADPVSPDSLLEALVDAPVAVLSAHALHSLTAGGGLDFGTEHGDGGPRHPRWLTAEAVERLPLRKRELAFLSACSSGQTAMDVPDEAIGLPAAFRHAGFQTVIATAWPVRDEVAFLTLTRFLQHRAAHREDSAATALRGTRKWLRTATREHLAVWLDELVATVGIPANLRHDLLKSWANCPDPTPYADPQDWAPYCATGH